MAEYTDYGEASAQELLEIMDAAYKASIPMLIFGDPGVGKTKLVQKYAVDKFGGPAITLLLATMDPTDIAGLPMKGTQEYEGHEVSVTAYGMPWWQNSLLRGKYPNGEPCKTLFIDEVTCCPPAVQSSVLSLIQDRILPCGEKLPDDVQIIAAANPQSSATDYNELASPLVNRLLLVSYKPTDKEVFEGLAGGWFSEEEQALWTDEERSWRERVVGFLRDTHGAYILKPNTLADGAMESVTGTYLNPDSENSDSEREILTSAWCSPRSWDNLIRVLSHTGFYPELNAVQRRIAAGMVGRQAEVELSEYAKKHKRIDVYDLIRHPEKQEWKVGSSEDAQYNDILEIANAINAAIPSCDGQDGRPTPIDAIQFYSKVIDYGGGAHFVSAFCQDTDDKAPGHYLKNIQPDGVPRKEWSALVNGTLKKFRTSNLIPDGHGAQ